MASHAVSTASEVVSPKRRHTDLEPLATGIAMTPENARQYRNSIHSSTPPATALPSPSTVAARAYYLDHDTYDGPKLNAQQRRRSLFEGFLIPRRHSAAVAAEGNLTQQLEDFTFSPKMNMQPVPESSELVPKIKVDDTSLVQLPRRKQIDLLKVGTIAARRNSKDVLVASSNVPFLYIHERLRDWGGVYLGNTATADAFVNAVSLRRPSLAISQDEKPGLQPGSSNLITIQARVVPKAKERKPFLIQRQFDVEDLRRSIPKSTCRSESANPPRLRRSTRQRRLSSQQVPTGRRGSADGRSMESLKTLRKGAVPLHIEYALHYLPVLGALMLSGHVRKGDSIDLPIPRPEAWRDVLSHIYTGKGEVYPAMRENILFLAGNAD